MEAAGSDDWALIGRHSEEAGDAERAVAAFVAAGREASRRSANEEALRLYDSVLRLVGALPEAQRNARTLATKVELSVPLIAVKGYSAPEVEIVLRDALARAIRLSDKHRRFTLTRSLWNCIYDQGDLPRCLQLAEELSGIAERSDRGDWQRLANRALGSTLMSQGQLSKARVAFGRCLDARQDWSRETTLFEHGEDPESVARQYLAWIDAVEGRIETGLVAISEAVEGALHLALPIAGSFARSIKSDILDLARDAEAAHANASAGLAVSEEQNFPFWAAQHTVILGWAGVHLGEGEAALDRACQGIALWKANNAGLHVPTWCAFTAEAALALGRLDIAEHCVDEALEIAGRTGENFQLAEILRLKGLLHAARDQHGPALSCFEASMRVARNQGAGFLLLRTAVDRVRLEGALGAVSSSARAALRHARAALTEGTALPDIRAADDLLGI